MIKNPLEKDTAKQSNIINGEKVEKTKETVKKVTKVLWRSRIVWSAIASIVSVVNPTIGKAITMLAGLFLGA